MSTTDAMSDGDVTPVGVRPDSALRGNLSTLGLIFTVLAFNGPLAIVVGFATVIIGYGNGLGAPMAFIVAAATIGIFSVGFLEMSKHVSNPGGFYSFIARGLGREAGLGASFLALVGYYVLILGGYAYLGISVESLVSSTLHGPEI